MSKESFDRKLAEVEALRSIPESEALPKLKKALKDRNNYVAAKAARIASECSWRALIPELVEAFERFLRDPVRSDSQCWAKNAIVKALKDLGFTDATLYIRGTKHFQMEPVWGGRVDTAATLRAASAHALVICPIDSFTVLTHLTDLLADAAPPVRIEAARAIARLSAREGALPLRLKALSGDAEPEVIGHCLISLLNLDTRDHLDFVASFLENDNPDLRIESAAALVESREPRALEILKNFWDKQADPLVKRALLNLFASSPLPESAIFLESVVESASPQISAWAREALNQSRHGKAE